MVKPLCVLPKPFVVVQFYPWFKFYFLLFLGIEMYDNEFETKEKKIWTKDKIELQHLSLLGLGWVNPLTVRGGLGKRPATFQFLMLKT